VRNKVTAGPVFQVSQTDMMCRMEMVNMLLIMSFYVFVSFCLFIHTEACQRSH